MAVLARTGLRKRPRIVREEGLDSRVSLISLDHLHTCLPVSNVAICDDESPGVNFP
jgi:hypothetical protein